MMEEDNNSTLPMDATKDEAVRTDEAVLATKLVGSDASSKSTTAKPINSSEQTTVKQEQPLLIDERFVIQKEIGRGGIGVAYLALDTKEDNKRVVLKALLEQSNAKDFAWVERHFREEMKALSRIHHPGVVKFITAGLMPYGKPYLAMEFIEGYELRSLIESEKGLRDFDRIASIIRQLGEAISAAHDVGIYHRDLKPENIMLTDSSGVEQVKVIDFGIATVKESLDEKTKTTALAGSIRYMAPEQLFGKPTAATDIYAMGVIAYEMITGRVPFAADLNHPLAAMQQLLEMQRGGVRVLPKDLRPRLPEKAQDIILRALAYQPSVRYQRADEFGAELSKALVGQDVDALIESYLNRTMAPDIQPTVQTVLQSAAPPKETPANTLDKPQKKALSKMLGATVLLLMMIALVAFGWNYLKNNPAKNNTEAKERALSYWAFVQKYKNGKPFGEPVRVLDGAMYFDTGDELQFFITSSDSGHLYLLSEEVKESKPLYQLLFPTPKANNALSQIQASAEIATEKGSFDKNTGNEKIWIIWSANPLAELEAEILKWQNEDYLGEIDDATKVAFIRNLLEQKSKANLRAERDAENTQVIVKDKSDLIVRLLNFTHK
jgi:serine/threonine protein kinase